MPAVPQVSGIVPSSGEALFFNIRGKVMTSNSKRGHDPLFKLFLREPVTARDFLEAHLPEDIRSLVHLDTLRLESGSYVDEELKELHSDILYSVKMAQDERCLLYCVVEHQSTEDEMMAWRMTKYTIRAMDDHLKKGYKTLPVVVPLLFYHGDVRPYRMEGTSPDYAPD
ncbi:hypothetical protein DOE63_16210 [Salmonella enterica subsp. diarizonae serovar 59:z10:-]|nr:hypothetical protein DOE63_16210 [Salmonella enterica subsp. diarizonae serovar 59:z10:-]